MRNQQLNPNFSSEYFSPNYLNAALGVAVESAMKVGPMLRENLGARGRNKYDTAEHSIVTDWDLRAQEIIIKNLERFDTSLGMHGEEANTTTKKDRYWTIDPIDGTLHYTMANGDKCHTAIALVEKRNCNTCLLPHKVTVPVVSVIYNFTHDTLYSATPVTASTKTLLATSGHETQQNISVSDTEHIYEIFSSTLEEGHALELKLCKDLSKAITLRNYAASLSMANIAEGKQDGIIVLDNPYTGQQDIAPGALLIAMAGGNVHSIGRTCFSCVDASSTHGIGSTVMSNSSQILARTLTV